MGSWRRFFFAPSFTSWEQWRTFYPSALVALVAASVLFWLSYLLIQDLVFGIFRRYMVGITGMLGFLCVIAVPLMLVYCVARWVLLKNNFRTAHAARAAWGLLIICAGELWLQFFFRVNPMQWITLALLLGGLWLFIRYFSEGSKPNLSTRPLY